MLVEIISDMCEDRDGDGDGYDRMVCWRWKW